MRSKTRSSWKLLLCNWAPWLSGNSLIFKGWKTSVEHLLEAQSHLPNTEAFEEKERSVI